MALQDPFDKSTGEFAKNIRAVLTGDDTELRESLKEFGWVKALPAFTDENGVVIVGHRRIRLAKEIGINPYIEKIEFGEGSDADAKRLRLAIASNIGFQAMTKADRQRIAEYLYGEREWTIQRIAQALNVSFGTAQRDVSRLSTVDKRVSKRGRAGEGRPKGSKNQRDQRESTVKKRSPKEVAETRPQVLIQLAQLLALEPARMLAEIVRHVRDARSEIEETVAKAERIGHARGFLRALGLSDADLKPIS